MAKLVTIINDENIILGKLNVWLNFFGNYKSENYGTSELFFGKQDIFFF